MALLTKSIYLAALAVLCLAGSGCSVVDPLLASEDYKVKAQGHREIRVTFEGGTKNVSRIHQQDVIQDLMLDLSRDPSQISLAFDAMLELEDFF